jgi:hypothetical protein
MVNPTTFLVQRKKWICSLIVSTSRHLNMRDQKQGRKSCTVYKGALVVWVEVKTSGLVFAQSRTKQQS